MRVLVEHYRELTWTYRARRASEADAQLAPRPPHERREVPPAVDRHLDASRVPRAAARARGHPPAAARAAAAGACPARPALLRASATADGSLSACAGSIQGTSPRRFAQAEASTARATLRLWQRRSAAAALVVSTHEPAIPAWLHDSFLCIHRFEGSWSREHRQRLLRRPAVRPSPFRASTAPSSSTASARPTTGRSGPSSRPRSGPTSPGGASPPGRTRPAFCGLL